MGNKFSQYFSQAKISFFHWLGKRKVSFAKINEIVGQHIAAVLLAMKTRNQYLVRFDPSIVTVKQSSIVSQIVSFSVNLKIAMKILFHYPPTFPFT